MRGLVIAGVALAACGGSERAAPDVDGVGDGARLQAQFLSAGDLRMPVRAPDGPIAWRDRQLGGECSFREEAGGLLCLPSMALGRSYEDADCTRPIVRAVHTDTCPAEGTCYLGIYDEDPCVGLRAVRPLLEQFTTTATYRKLADGTCQRGDLEPELAFRTGDEQPLSIFVGGHLEPRGGEARLDILDVVGDDGSREPWSFYDRELGAACQAMSLEPAIGGDGCVPNRSFAGVVWADDACTVPLASEEACWLDRAHPFVVAWRRSDAGCDEYHTFRLGDPVAPEAIYTAVGDACVAGEIAPERQYFALGDEVALAPLALEPRGDGRLRPYYHVAEGGAELRELSATLFDAELGVPCSLEAPFDDEVLFCIPTVADVETAYTDAACTQPISVGVWWASHPCAEPLDPHFARDDAGTYYDLGEPLPAGSIYTIDDTGACAVDPNIAYAIPGAVRSLTDFVEIERP